MILFLYNYATVQSMRNMLIISWTFNVDHIVANKSKVLYGLLKEPELNIALDDEEDVQEADDKPRVGTGNR